MLELRTIDGESKVVESVSYTQERIVERTDYLAEIAKLDEAISLHDARKAKLLARKAELLAKLAENKDKFDTVEAEKLAKVEAIRLVEEPIIEEVVKL